MWDHCFCWIFVYTLQNGRNSPTKRKHTWWQIRFCLSFLSKFFFICVVFPHLCIYIPASSVLRVFLRHLHLNNLGSFDSPWCDRMASLPCFERGLNETDFTLKGSRQNSSWDPIARGSLGVNFFHKRWKNWQKLFPISDNWTEWPRAQVPCNMTNPNEKP